MKNSFCIKRCSQVLRWLVSVNRLTLLGLFSGVAVGMFLIELGIYFTKMDLAPDDYIRHVAAFATFCLVLSAVLCVSLAFTKFTQLGTRQQRATFLMLPAANSEKFLAVILYVTVVCMSVGIAGFVVADVLRMGLMAAWNQLHPLVGVSYIPGGAETCWWSSAIPEVVRNLSPRWVNASDNYSYTLAYRVMYLVVMYSLALFVHAHYTLGATLLRRYSFVISSIVIILWAMLTFKMSIHFELSMFRPVWVDNHYLSQEVGGAAFIFDAMLLIAAFNCYWISFRIFKHFELMTNKWTNANKLKNDDILKR